MKSAVLLVLPFLITALPAQSPVPVRQKPAPSEVNGGDEVKLNDSGEPMYEGRPSKKVNSEIVPRVRAASAFCMFYVHTEPTKLMPGETGKLIVTASLKDRAVLPSPAPLRVTSPATQGQLTLGPATVLPAELGRLPGAYRGRPVYDNWATIEMPITVAASAPVGKKQSVVVEFSFELFDGNTAQSLGEFVDRALGQIEIGKSYDPQVQGGYEAPAAAAAAAAEPQPEIRPMADDPDEPLTPAVGGAEPLPVVDSGAQAKAVAPIVDEGPVAQIEDDEGNRWILIVGGGALALAVLLLVLKKK